MNPSWMLEQETDKEQRPNSPSQISQRSQSPAPSLSPSLSPSPSPKQFLFRRTRFANRMNSQPQLRQVVSQQARNELLATSFNNKSATSLALDHSFSISSHSSQNPAPDDTSSISSRSQSPHNHPHSPSSPSQPPPLVRGMPSAMNHHHLLSRRRSSHNTLASSQTHDPEFDQYSETSESEDDDEGPDLVVAMHNFVPDAASTTCLPFQKGTIIRVLSRDDSGWWDGEFNGRRGWFPSNYVEALRIDDVSSTTTTAIKQNHSHEGLSHVVSFADLQSSAATTLSSSISMEFSTSNDRDTLLVSPTSTSERNKSLLDPVYHAISLLVNACHAHRIAHFQPATACIISSIRSLLSATDCLTRDSPILKQYPILMRERKFILSDLSQLVNQARKASSLLVSDTARTHEIKLMEGLAMGVQSNVENFLRVARDCGIHVPDRHQYEAARDSSSHHEHIRSNNGAVLWNPNFSMHRSQSHGDLLRNQDYMAAYTRLSRSQSSNPAYPQGTSSTLQPPLPISSRSSTASSTHPISPSSSILSQEEVSKVTNEYDQLLSLVAAVIGHIHTHSRSSHPSSCAHLIDMTRETVNRVRALLAIIESTVCNNPAIAHRFAITGETKEYVDLLAAREALYVVTTNLVTSARVITTPLAEDENQDEEKQELLQAATGVLRSAGECVTGMKLVLAGMVDTTEVFVPSLSSTIPPDVNSAEMEPTEDGSDNSKRKHTLSYLGRKATSLNCLRERYAVDGEVEQVMREVMRENRLQSRSESVASTRNDSIDATAPTITDSHQSSDSRTSLASDDSNAKTATVENDMDEQKSSVLMSSSLLSRRGVSKYPDPLQNTKMARGVVTSLSTRPRGSSISSIPEHKTASSAGISSMTLHNVSEDDDSQGDHASAPPTPISLTGETYIQSSSNQRQSQSQSSLIAEFPSVPFQMPTPVSPFTTTPGYNKTNFNNGTYSQAMSRSTTNSIESTLSNTESVNTRASLSSEERNRGSNATPLTSPEMSTEEITVSQKYPDKETNNASTNAPANNSILLSQIPRRPAVSTTQSAIPRGPIMNRLRPRAKTNPIDRDDSTRFEFTRRPAIPTSFSPGTQEWFLQKDYRDEDIVYNSEDGTINRATIDALIVKLSMHDSITDPTLIKTFFLTFRAFTNPRELVQAFIRRFNIQRSKDRNMTEKDIQIWQERKALPVRLRVYNNLKTWLEFYWSVEEDREALDDIEEFLQTKMVEFLNPPAIERMRDLIKKRREEDVDPRVKALQQMQIKDNGLSAALQILRKSPSQDRLNQIYATGSAGVISTLDISSQSPPTPNLSSKVLSNLRAMLSIESGGITLSSKSVPNVQVTDIHPLELARQLAVMENKLFRAILPNELASNEFEKSTGESKAVHVKAVSALSTQITGWVTETILNEKDTKRRVNMLKHFIKVTQRCYELQNYASVFSILCAISSSPIFRLKKTWDGLSAKHRQMYDFLNRKFSCLRNYGEYRKLVITSSAPGVPFLGVWLSDLTFLKAGNRTFRPNPNDAAHDYINFDKFRRVYALISEVQRFQQPYNLMEVPEMQAWLVRKLEGISVFHDVDDLYRRSCIIEPRAGDDHTSFGFGDYESKKDTMDHPNNNNSNKNFADIFALGAH